MDVTAEETLTAAANGLESTAATSGKKKKAKKRNKSKNIGTNPNPEQQQISEVDVNSTSTSGKRQNGLLEDAAAATKTTTHENSVDKVSEKLDQALQLNSNKNKNGLTNGTVSGSEEHQHPDGTTTTSSNGAVSKKRHRNKHKSKSQPVNCQESPPAEELPPAQNCPKPVAVEPTPAPPPEEPPKPQIDYREYESELQMPSIMALIQKDLSEPYSIYTYRYFIHNWPRLCFLALHEGRCVGAIVCKLDIHRQNIRRGYIAMLAVDKDYRKLKIGTTLVQKAIQAMLEDDADEVVLETEITNRPALRLYENLGFVRDKRLFHYYLNGVDALRLKLWFR